MRWMKSAKIEQRATRELVWNNEADAISCRDLLMKADRPKGFDIEFVRFVPEKPL